MSNICRSDVANSRAPTSAVWAGFDFEALRNWDAGFMFEEDFTLDTDLTNLWTVTQAGAAGTFLMGDAKGGVALIDAGSTTSTQGANVQAGTTVGEMFIPDAEDTIAFECRFKYHTAVATGGELFFGLSVIDTTIIAASAMSSQSIGFKSLTDNGVILAMSKDGSAEVTSLTEDPTFTVTTLVDGAVTTDGTEWFKLGFRVVGTTRVDYYVNGTKVGYINSNIPATEMVPSFVCQASGTTQPVVHLDWVRCAQLIGGLN